MLIFCLVSSLKNKLRRGRCTVREGATITEQQMNGCFIQPRPGLDSHSRPGLLKLGHYRTQSFTNFIFKYFFPLSSSTELQVSHYMNYSTIELLYTFFFFHRFVLQTWYDCVYTYNLFVNS